MVAWIKMPLGMNVGLGPGRVMLHEDRARPSEKGHIGNMHGKIGKDRACGSEDMLADRQTQTQTDTHRHTQTHTDILIAILRNRSRGRTNNEICTTYIS